MSGIVDAIGTAYNAYKTGKKIEKSAELAKDTVVLAKKYVTEKRELSEISLTNIEAWQVYFTFFEDTMKSVKPSSLKNEDCKDAERIIISAWEQYHALNFILEVGKKFILSPKALEPLGIAHLVVKVMSHYIDSKTAPTKVQIGQFDKNGGVIRDEIKRQWRNTVTVKFQVGL